MKKLFLAVAAVAMVFATSCKKENVNEPEVAGDNEFICVIDQNANPQNAPAVEDGMGTMAHIDASNNVWWQAGDHIMYHGNENTLGVGYYTLTCSKMAGDGRAYFSDQTGNDYHFYQGAHEAYYPATLYDGTALKLPHSITIAADKNAAFLPMYGTGNGTHYLTFNNMCAVLKITVPVACDKIVLTAANIAGTFNVTDGKAVVTSGTNTITVNGAFTTDKLVYVAIPEGTYSTFKIEFYDGTTPLRDKTMTNMPVFAGKIYPVYTNTCPAPSDAFYFEREGSNNTDYVKLAVPATPGAINPTLQYCRSGENVWTDYTNGQNITFGSGNTKIYIRAKGTANYFCNTNGISATKKKGCLYTTYNGRCYSFTSSCNVEIGGNIMYLYDKTGTNTSLTDHFLAGLFANMTTLTNASNISFPSNLSTTSGYDQFKFMFYGCTGLTNAGFALTFDKVSQRMFGGMFQNCNNLTAAPTIKATATTGNSVVDGTCSYMFYGCTSLAEITFNVLCSSTSEITQFVFQNWLPTVTTSGHNLKTKSETSTWLNNNSRLYGWSAVTL